MRNSCSTPGSRRRSMLWRVSRAPVSMMRSPRRMNDPFPHDVSVSTMQGPAENRLPKLGVDHGQFVFVCTTPTIGVGRETAPSTADSEKASASVEAVLDRRVRTTPLKRFVQQLWAPFHGG